MPIMLRNAWALSPRALLLRVRLFRAIVVGLSVIWLNGACLDRNQATSAQNAADPQSRGSVFLETDTTAVKKLGAARDSLSAKSLTPKEWSDTIDSLRQIAEQHKDKLVAIESGRYVSVQSYCDILLASLPAEALKVYRSRVDPLARQWFEAGQAVRDEELLLKVVRQAAISSFGDDSLLLLGELAWERGELSRARTCWQRLVPLAGRGAGMPPGLVLAYPDTNLDPALIRARLVLCSLMQGNMVRGQTELEVFKEQYSQARGTLAGRTGSLAQILGEVTDEAARTQPPADDPGVATFAFNPQRNKLLPEAVDIGKSEWSVLLRDDDPAKTEGLLDLIRQPLALQSAASHYPVVFNDIVLVCDETSVYAYKLHSGEPAWPAETLTEEQRKAETPEEFRKRARIYTLPPEKTQAAAFPVTLAGFPRFTLTVEQGRLYGRLGSVTTARPGGVRAHGAASFLVCLDLARGQGKELWLIDADQIEPERENWAFEGSPLVAGGRVYVALRRNASQPQSNVACYDAETGKLIWNRKICVGMSSLGVEEHEISHQLLTLGEDCLYYNTNLGAIAAIETLDGGLRWVATYRRAEVETSSEINRRQKHGLNPCLYHEGVVYVAPTDSDQLLAYDADSGIPRWGKTDVELRGQARGLLGVGKGKLIVGGDQVHGVDLETGKVVWTYGDRDRPGYGRGLLAEDLVYWPTFDEIVILNQATGMPVRDPVNMKEKGAGGGNLAISGGLLLVARHDWMGAFSEYGGVKKRQQDQIILRPNAALPHYQLAVLEEATGAFESALTHYREALRLARPDELRDALPLREVAATRLYELLDKLAQAAIAKKEYAAAAGYYTQAVEAAPSRRQAGNALADLGLSQERNQQPQAAIETYQKILNDPDLNDASRTDASLASAAIPRILDAGDPAGGVASIVRHRIAALIERLGSAVYARWDAAAEVAFTEAFRRNDTQKVQELLHRYPNARTSEPAALRLAGLFASGRKYLAAGQTYKRLLSPESSAATRQSALTELARLAEAQQFWRTAADCWRRLAREFPKSKLSEQGREWAIPEFVTRHLAQDVFREQEPLIGESSAPGSGSSLLLLRRWNHRRTPDSETIIPVGRPPAAALGCVLLLNDGVICLNQNDGTVRWEAAVDGRIDWAGYVGNLLAFATAQSVSGVTLDGGRTVWELKLHQPAGPPQSAGSYLADTSPAESAATQRFPHASSGPGGSATRPRFELAADGDRLFCLRPGRDLCAIDGDDGSIAWRHRPAAGKLQPYWHCDADRLVVQARNPGRITVLNPHSGAVQSDFTQPAMNSENSPDEVAPWVADPVALANGTLGMLGTNERVQLLDVSSGKVRWTYRGPMSQAHAPPDLLTNGSALLLVVDATTLVRVDPETGVRLWSRSVGADFLFDARHAVCLDEQRAYVPSAGVLRCFELKTGNLAWEQYLGPRDAGWHAAPSGGYVAAWPSKADGRVPLILCDAETGDYVQKLNFDGPARSVDFQAGPKVAVFYAGTQIVGLGR